MKEQILKALREKYANLGLGEKVLNSTADFLAGVATQETIGTVVAGAETMLKAAQGEADSIRTKKSELEKRLVELEARAKEVQPSIQTKEEPQIDPIVSKLQELIAPIMEKVNAIETKTVNKTYAEMAEQRLKDKMVKEFYSPFLAEKTFTSEADVESFTNQIESVYKVAQQAKANEALGSMGQPGRGNTNPNKDEASQNEIEKMAAAMGLKTK